MYIYKTFGQQVQKQYNISMNIYKINGRLKSNCFNISLLTEHANSNQLPVE